MVRDPAEGTQAGQKYAAQHKMFLLPLSLFYMTGNS